MTIIHFIVYKEGRETGAAKIPRRALAEAKHEFEFRDQESFDLR